MAQREFTKDEILKIHEKAVKRFQQSVLDEHIQRTDYVDNMKFVDGEQWPPDVLKARGDRVSLVINDTRKFCENVSNMQRMSTPSIKATPDGYGTSNEDAETRNILFAHIQQQGSGAKQAYDHAFDCSVKGNYGYFRLLAKQVDPNSFDNVQDMYLEEVADPLSVVYDQSSKKLLYEDARYCFVVQDIPDEDFKEQYPKAQPIDWEKTTVIGTKSVFFNFSEKKVKVAEYYFHDHGKKTLGKYSNDLTYDMGNDYFKKEIQPGLESQGITLVATKEADTDDVYWCKMNGVEIIEGPLVEASPDIPMFIVPGRVTWINGKRYYSALAKDAKDPNRMMNFWCSAGTEQIGAQSSSEYLVTAEAIAGNEADWEAQSPQKYKRYNAGTEKPFREPPSQMSSGIASMIALTKEQIPSVIGISPDRLGQPTNARSKSAIAERSENSDVGPYIFTDHFLKSLRHAGQVINRRMSAYYDTARLISITGDDGKEKKAEINSYDPATGGVKNDISKGQFKVVIETGPSYSTLRKETADNMINAAQYFPDYQDVILPLIAKAQSWAGAREMEEAIVAKNEAMKAPKPPSVFDQKQTANLQGAQLENSRKMLELKNKGVESEPAQPGQAENPQGGQ